MARAHSQGYPQGRSDAAGPDPRRFPGVADRSVAQLDMLHSLAPRLNRLNDVEQVGEAITAELETIIDYHNCRIYLLQPDGKTLLPVAFRGRLGEYETETVDELITEIGEGITGRVAQDGESMLIDNALDIPWAVTIDGTDDIDESMLAVPLKYGDRVTGVIVLSSLGIGLFDREDLRLLEVLASHAAVAFENARLFQMEREAAETSSALLDLSQSLTKVHEIEAVLRAAIQSVPELIGCSAIAAYVRDAESGTFFMAAQRGFDLDGALRDAKRIDIEAQVAEPFLRSTEEPFILTRETLAQVPPEYSLMPEVRETLVAPLHWEPDGFGALAIVATNAETSFGERDLRHARGVAQITSLALGNARRFHELERFHDLVEGLDAIFWEADPSSLRFSFMSRKATEMLGPAVGSRDASDPERNHDRENQAWDERSWGDHVHPGDRERVLTQVHAAVDRGVGTTAEYRRLESDSAPMWIRDLVSVVRHPAGEIAVLRGLMVDITERKRAEEVLQASERKYSEAFERERQAAGRLRALDEMKNTFLEAVSHDLRTPLTSILGSAITLEQKELNLPHGDALDLLRRIVANARKLERLLGDLLDLDRLQRGIVTPKRRPTDVGAIARLACEQTELIGSRTVELQAEPVVANVDAAKVERIVENLLVNAAKHTPPSARLWVRIRPESDGVLIVVEDEGPGVPAEQREAIFEPFRQLHGTSNPSPGVGIGLSLVARFAELHGGRAWVEERAGGGASFHVFLPGV